MYIIYNYGYEASPQKDKHSFKRTEPLTIQSRGPSSNHYATLPIYNIHTHL